MKLTLDVPAGDTLTDVVAGYLNEGTPSAMLARILEGFDLWDKRASATGDTPIEDLKWAQEVASALTRLLTNVRVAEDSYYYSRINDAADFYGKQRMALAAVAHAVR